MVVRSSEWVKERVPSSSDLGRPFSTELHVDTLYRQRGDAALTADGVVREQRSEVPAHTRMEFRQRGQEDADTVLGNLGVDIDSDHRFYKLDDETTYVATFVEDTGVPEGMVGYVAPREALLSIGVMMHGSFVGTEESRTAAMLYVDDRITCLEVSAPLAELVVWEPDEARDRE